MLRMICDDQKSELETVQKLLEDYAGEHPDLFLSIHANATTNSTASGVECHIYGTDGESDSLAVEICKEIAGRLGAKNRGVKMNPGLCVLNSTVMPAVLVELAYLSNTSDAEKLKNDQSGFAWGIYNGLLSYFGFPELS